MRVKRIAFLFPSLQSRSEGRVDLVQIEVANRFAKLGYEVNLVVVSGDGVDASHVRYPDNMKLITLNAKRALYSIPALCSLLRETRPDVLVSTLDYLNVTAVLCRLICRVRLRVIGLERNTLSVAARNAPSWRGRRMALLARLFYPRLDATVAVSSGVADDLVRTAGLPREKVSVIYNPVVTRDLYEKAEEPVAHPWFQHAEPPVVLGVGRLTAAKDFETLIRAFALVRKERRARLLILGEGEQRARLQALVRELRLETDAALPGWVGNPYKYMKRAAVFVLSSKWEGFGNVIVESMALGTPVVSTDCPNGPAEILEGGKWGRLVQVGDHNGLAVAIIQGMEERRNRAFARAQDFSADRIMKQYEHVVLG